MDDILWVFLWPNIIVNHYTEFMKSLVTYNHWISNIIKDMRSPQPWIIPFFSHDPCIISTEKTQYNVIV